VRLAERRGCWLVQNPRSNEGNHVGYPRALWASGHVALGTDGYPSDMNAETQALVRLAKLHTHQEPTGAAGVLRRLEAGRRLAAERLGPEDRITSDRAELETAQAEGGCRARTLRVGGRTVVEQGRLTGADLEAIRAEARAEAARLWSRMEAL
jgi:hypothetical protein